MCAYMQRVADQRLFSNDVKPANCFFLRTQLSSSSVTNYSVQRKMGPWVRFRSTEVEQKTTTRIWSCNTPYYYQVPNIYVLHSKRKGIAGNIALTCRDSKVRGSGAYIDNLNYYRKYSNSSNCHQHLWTAVRID